MWCGPHIRFGRRVYGPAEGAALPPRREASARPGARRATPAVVWCKVDSRLVGAPLFRAHIRGAGDGNATTHPARSQCRGGGEIRQVAPRVAQVGAFSWRGAGVAARGGLSVHRCAAHSGAHGIPGGCPTLPRCRAPAGQRRLRPVPAGVGDDAPVTAAARQRHLQCRHQGPARCSWHRQVVTPRTPQFVWRIERVMAVAGALCLAGVAPRGPAIAAAVPR